MSDIMKQHSVTTTTALSAAVETSPAAAGFAIGTGPGDTADLKAAVNQFLRALDNLDWDLFQESWATEPSVFFPFSDTPERVDGKAAVGERFKVFFDQVKQQTSGPPYLKLEPKALRITRHGDAGLVSFTLGGLSPVGGLSGSIGRRTILFVLENGEWKVVHLHASAVGG